MSKDLATQLAIVYVTNTQHLDVAFRGQNVVMIKTCFFENSKKIGERKRSEQQMNLKSFDI